MKTTALLIGISLAKNRRDKLDIYADILKAIGKNTKKTHVVYEANLNFKRCKEYLKEMRNEGLVEIRSNSPLAWCITEKGREFVKKYDEVRELIPN